MQMLDGIVSREVVMANEMTFGSLQTMVATSELISEGLVLK